MQKKKRTTSIANWLRYKRSRASLDESAKQLLSNPVVLAWILKYSVEEFSEYDIQEIEDMIEGEPDISKIRLEPGLSVIPLLHRFQKEKIDGKDSGFKESWTFHSSEYWRKYQESLQKTKSAYSQSLLITQTIFW